MGWGKLIRRVPVVRWVACALTVMLAAATLSTIAAAQTFADETIARPRIGLVLGGGGAKGLAHVGVLQVLEKYHVPVDAVAGTSMGAIVGALYASGMNADEIERVSRTVDWAAMFNDRPDRRRVNFRRKQDDQDFLTSFRVSFADRKLVLPRGLLQGQKLFVELSSLLEETQAVTDFNHFPIPYRAVATNLETGQAVVLRDGDPVTAVLASMAVPGAIQPVERDGLLLIDGGIANNVPIDVARSMGVDIVIVVDVGAKVRGREDLATFLDVFDQSLRLLSAENTEDQLDSLAAADVLMQPQLGDMTLSSFDRVHETIEPGRVSAEALSDRLLQLGLSETDWRAHLAARAARVPQTPIVDVIRIDQNSPLSDRIVEGFFRAEQGRPLNVEELNEDIDDLSGLGSFGRVTYGVRTSGKETTLVVDAHENAARRHFFRFGVLLETDFKSGARYQVGASYTMRNLNRFGGEWRTILQLGSDIIVGTEFYQPLGSRLDYFIHPQLLGVRSNSLVYGAGSVPIAEVRLTVAELGLDAGRQLGRWGEFRVGYHRGSGQIEPSVGNPGFSKITFDDNFYFVQLDVDTLDSLSFPEHGGFLRSSWTDHFTSAGGDFAFDQIDVRGFSVFSRGANTVQLGAKFGTIVNAGDGFVSGFSLGGFQNLSGLPRDRLSGRHLLYGQATYYRRLTERGPILKMPILAGGSLEVGNVYADLDDVSGGSQILAGSLFAGVDSPLGPIYLAGGYADTGDASAYLFVGQTF